VREVASESNFARRPGLAVSAAALALFAVAAVLAGGYSFGVADHAIHLVFLRRAMDPGFLPGDLLASAGFAHASLFWDAQAPLARVLDIEVLYAILHAGSLLLMLAGAAALARALFRDEDPVVVGGVAMLLAAVGSQTFAFIPTFDALMLNRTAVLGGELFALALAVRRRFLAAFILTGLLFLLHATTASHAAVLVFVLACADSSRLRSATLGPLLFLAAASPVLIPAIGTGGAGDRDAWWLAVELNFPLHHFVAWFGPSQWGNLLVPLVVIAAGARRSPPALLLVAGVLATCAAGFAAIEWLRVPQAIELHLYESTRFLGYIAFAAAGALAARGLRSGLPSRIAAIALVAALVGFGTYSTVRFLDHGRPSYWAAAAAVVATALLCGALIRRRAIGPSSVSPARSPVWAIAIAAVCVLVALPLGRIRGPAASIAPALADADLLGRCGEYRDRGADPTDACGLPLMRWARDHLPRDAVVVTPPYAAHPMTAFRYAAERSVLVNFKDGGEATFSPRFAREWLDRLVALTGDEALLAIGPRTSLALLARVGQAHAGFERADRSRFLDLRRRYGATHAVLPRYAAAAALDLPVLYQDSAYRLVGIPAAPHDRGPSEARPPAQ
jgi:hypothetical protein